MSRVLLSVVVTLAKTNREMTIAELKDDVTKCLSATKRMDDLLELDNFLLLMDNLFDAGLLSTSVSTSGAMNLAGAPIQEVMSMPIQLRAPMEDLETALDSELVAQSHFYQKLRENAIEISRQKGPARV